jgi:flagellar hook assembly protein FlgD
VTLQVFDLSGRIVRTLLRGEKVSGPRVVTWNGDDDSGNAAGSGVYFYRLQAGKETLARKLVLVR